MVKRAIIAVMAMSVDVPNPKTQGQGCGPREIQVPGSLWMPRRPEESLKELERRNRNAKKILFEQ